MKNTVKEPKPLLPVPTQSQLNWHQAEYIMFAHFGMKTFYPSNDHMGYGKEEPGRFNPAKFDATQWVEAAKAGGFKGIVLTTKHHDGFCNWQTDTTDHCVKSSPWKNGKGDIVRELGEACRKGGVYFGIYISIIDKHYEIVNGGYEGYGDYYCKQLKELSTKYGPVDEYWFDGFSSDTLKLDYQRIAELIREAQPDAVVYDSGTLVKYLPDRCIAWPGAHGGVTPDQNYCQEIEGVMRWYPGEPSLILQGNWFHNGEPMVPQAQIQDYYLSSTGYSVTPLMNVSPNADGLIDEASVDALKQFKTWVDELHSNDLVRTPPAKVSADSFRGNRPRYAPACVVNDDPDTYFATDDDVTTAVIEVEFGSVQKVDGFILQEYIRLGQRVSAYSIECRVDGKWVGVFSGKTIGHKRIIVEGRGSAADLRFPATDAVRLKIDKALACPLISTFKVIGSVARSNRRSGRPPAAAR